jgi:hypothetical protein
MPFGAVQRDSRAAEARSAEYSGRYVPSIFLDPSPVRDRIGLPASRRRPEPWVLEAAGGGRRAAGGQSVGGVDQREAVTRAAATKAAATRAAATKAAATKAAATKAAATRAAAARAAATKAAAISAWAAASTQGDGDDSAAPSRSPRRVSHAVKVVAGGPGLVWGLEGVLRLFSGVPVSETDLDLDLMELLI